MRMPGALPAAFCTSAVLGRHRFSGTSGIYALPTESKTSSDAHGYPTPFETKQVLSRGYCAMVPCTGEIHFLPITRFPTQAGGQQREATLATEFLICSDVPASTGRFSFSSQLCSVFFQIPTMACTIMKSS